MSSLLQASVELTDSLPVVAFFSNTISFIFESSIVVVIDRIPAEVSISIFEVFLDSLMESSSGVSFLLGPVKFAISSCLEAVVFDDNLLSFEVEQRLRVKGVDGDGNLADFCQ